ncbi:ABC-F family ATP-binding cassette domain-containing protein [Vagococcus coleopterorum]|uniref:ABC-F family ATP-binding cassette domain-containing protein n=1 Tax=Vagococcus coleopterorum TaxID=2714946 RepID=A0A6G8AP01_9ENTE|nr:ATP-binding cassette domain-containing protein [Vagococcus coleopterorum]QIL46801.1 ABC-F family ATP-binding cassette domain-containing protein [Vagococcus coleopterorum]
MMTLKKVSMTEKKTGRQLLNELDLAVNPGDKIAIIGEEGNGKSTLLKLMRGRDYVPDYVETSGEVKTKASVIGYLSQQHQVATETMVMDLFPEVDWNDDLLRAMKDFGIDNLYSEQLFHTLSGGEKTRYLILSVLAIGPEMLLLDEPTNDIDLATINWLEQFIKQTTMPVVYVSHDEAFIEATANCILHIELAGRKDQPLHTIDYQDYRTYRDRRLNRISKNEQDIQTQKRALQEKEAKLQQVWQKAEHQHQHVNRADPRLQKKVANLKNQKSRLEKDKANVGELLAYEKESYFSFAYLEDIHRGKLLPLISVAELRNEKGVLSRDIELQVLTGDKVVITGENGVGKSTLLKEISHQLAGKEVGYMPQRYDEVLELTKSAVEFLQITGDADERTEIYTALGNVNFTREEMLQSIGKLSGGQQAKILLLRMIREKKEILLLDEPTRNLSPITNPHLYQELKNFKGTIISVSHDRKFIKEIGTKIYQMTSAGLNVLEVR